MNKKAIFMPTLAMATLFLMTYAYFVFIVKDPELYYVNTLGNNQIALTNAYKEAEKDLLYNELAIKYSIYQTSEEFTNNAGVNVNCNKLWKFESKDCNPKLEENFKIILETRLKNYNLELKEFKIENNIITITFNDKVYNNNLNNFEFTYTVKQEFSYESMINFTKILEIKDKLDKCSQKSESLDMCTSEKITKSNDLIYFTIENNKNIFSLSPSPGFKQLKFEFGINEKDAREKVV